MEFADAPAKKYCNPSTDCYIKNVGVDEKARGKGLLGTAVAELCGNMPIYLETHTESKVALYGKTGFGLNLSLPRRARLCDDENGSVSAAPF